MKWKPAVRTVRLGACIAPWALLLLWWIQDAGAAELAAEDKIAILYPPASPPAKAIYDDIRRGIERALRGRGAAGLELLVERGRPNARELREWSESNKVRAAIALGRLALDQADVLRGDLPVLAGGVNLEGSPGVSGVNLTPNPTFLLSRLRELMPSASRVLVVTGGVADAPLMRAARAAARPLGLEIVEFPAKDLREATQHYWNLFRYANPRTDAVWLVGGPLVDAQSTLPSILENAWAERFVVISNVVEHVRQGALLGTFLNGDRLGERLGGLAVDAAVGRNVGLSWGEDVDFAINARVALHLGIPLNERTKARYGLVVSER
jgi:ABC-type uncharacterized transport system substrate-binding protein